MLICLTCHDKSRTNPQPRTGWPALRGGVATHQSCKSGPIRQAIRYNPDSPMHGVRSKWGRCPERQALTPDSPQSPAFCGGNRGCRARRCIPSTWGLHPMREMMREGALSTNGTPCRIHDTTSCSQEVVSPPRHATVCFHVKDSRIGYSCFRPLAHSSTGWSLDILQLFGDHSAPLACPSAILPAVD
jgi:hypothetical protein